MSEPVFSLSELEGLRMRAELEARRLAENVDVPNLEWAYLDLARQLDIIHAMEIRRGELEQPIAVPHVHVDASETPEAIAAGSEEGEPVEEPLDTASVTFKIKQKKSTRFCEVCGGVQWKSDSGWVCTRGDGGAGSVTIPFCCDRRMTPATDEETGDLLSVSCGECAATFSFAEIADPGA